MISALAVAQAQSSALGWFVNLVVWGLVYLFGLSAGLNYARKKNKANETVGQAGLVVSLFVLFFFYVSSSLDQAFLYFLLSLQAARNFTLATKRDLYFSLVVSFVVVLFAASISKETIFIIYIILYSLAALFTFMTEHIDSRLALASGGDKLTLTRHMNFPFNTGLLTSIILFLSLLLYLLVPRLDAINIGGFPVGGGQYYQKNTWKNEADNSNSGGKQSGTGDSEYAGDSDNYDSSGQQKGSSGINRFPDKYDVNSHNDGKSGGSSGSALPNYLLFYLQSNRPLYVRTKTYDVFDGANWYRDYIPKINVGSDGFNTFNFDSNDTSGNVRQVYNIEHQMDDWIPAAYRPVMLRFPSKSIYQGIDDTILVPGVLQKGTVYSVSSIIQYREGRAYETGNIDQAVLSKEYYLGLPENFSQNTSELARAISQQAGNDFQRALLVEQYLRNNYKYTLSTVGQPPKENLIEDFLTNTREGHCEIFASTLTIMLRALDIPARFVVGYTASQINPITGYYEVRSINAHAWVEAYIQDLGWVTFEPTPPYNPDMSDVPTNVMQALMNSLKKKRDLSGEPGENGESTGPLAMINFTLNWWDKLRAAFNKIIESLKQSLLWLWSIIMTYGLVLLAVFVVTGGAGYLLWRYINWYPLMDKLDLYRLGRARKKDQRYYILLCYKTMEKIFSRRGVKRKQYWTHDEYKNVIIRKFGGLRNQVNFLTKLFSIVRYSSQPVKNKQAEQAENSFTQLVTGLKEM